MFVGGVKRHGSGMGDHITTWRIALADGFALCDAVATEDDAWAVGELHCSKTALVALAEAAHKSKALCGTQVALVFDVGGPHMAADRTATEARRQASTLCSRAQWQAEHDSATEWSEQGPGLHGARSCARNRLLGIRRRGFVCSEDSCVVLRRSTPSRSFSGPTDPNQPQHMSSLARCAKSCSTERRWK